MEDVSPERWLKIRRAADTSKRLGINDRAVRREAVIDANSARRKGILSDLDDDAIAQIGSVAEENIRDEPKDVRERAYNKYLEITVGESNLPVMVDAPHSIKPNKSLVNVLLEESGTDSSDVQVIADKIASDNIESYTGTIAIKIAEKLQISTLLPKKSRVHADINRHWFNRDEKKYPSGEGDITTKNFEYPRSAKAALYWGIDKILSMKRLLDDKGKLRNPYCRLSIHGMKDNGEFDFAVAGAGNAADGGLVSWFNDRLNQEIQEIGLNIDGENPKSVIAERGDPKTALYSGVGSLSNFRKDIKGSQHPSFGENFNTIQLEISKRLRVNKEYREKVINILSEVLKETPTYFTSHNAHPEN